MVGIRNKLCWGRSVGVYLNGDCITITEVGNTPMGRTILRQYGEKVGETGPGAVLKELLEKHLSRRQRRSVPICLGLGPEQTFFITYACNFEPNVKPSLKNLLKASGAASALEPDKVVADYFKISKLKLMGNQLWTLAACRRELAQQLFSSALDAEVQNIRLQPGPLSLLSETKRKSCHNKSWKVILRVFLHESGGLVTLVIDGRIVLWREFAYSTAPELETIISAIQTVRAHAATSLSNPTVDGIILQGHRAEKFVEGITDSLRLKVAVTDDEGFTETRCSYNLALSAKGNGEQAGLDLFRTLRKAPSIWAMFPLKRAVIVAIAAVCMGFMMWQKVEELNNKYENLKLQNASYEWSHGKRTGEISKERKQLLAEVQAVSKFLSTRVIWSDYLSDLPTRLPLNACLSNIWAVRELKEMNKKKQGRKIKQSLTMRGVTKFDKGVAAPEEIDAFLESLRNVELLRRDFPQVELAEIKWRREGNSEIAMFTIVAMPKQKTSSKDES